VLTQDGTVALRGLFLIDRNGIVRHALVNDLPIGRSVDEGDSAFSKPCSTSSNTVKFVPQLEAGREDNEG